MSVRKVSPRATGMVIRNRARQVNLVAFIKIFECCIRPLITGARHKVHFFGEYFHMWARSTQQWGPVLFEAQSGAGAHALQNLAEVRRPAWSRSVLECVRASAA